MILRKHRLWHLLAPDYRPLRESENTGRALTQDEAHRLLTAARKSRSQSLYPALVLLINTGLRVSELRTLQWRQVDLLDRFLTVGRSKTKEGEGRVVPLNQDAFAALTRGGNALIIPFPLTSFSPQSVTVWMARMDTKTEPFACGTGTRKKPLEAGRSLGEPAGPLPRWSAACTIFATRLFHDWRKPRPPTKQLWLLPVTCPARCWSATAMPGTKRSGRQLRGCLESRFKEAPHRIPHIRKRGQRLQCSNPMILNGGRGGDRTHNHRLRRPVLYPIELLALMQRQAANVRLTTYASYEA